MVMPIVSVEQLLILAITLFIPPIFGMVILIIVLATVGKSLGIRKAYVGLLLKIFEWASRRIERANAKAKANQDQDESNSCEDEVRISSDDPDRSPSPTSRSFIHKDATMRLMRTISVSEPEKSQAFVFIGDCLDFVKAGVEAIIDDEVTSRFSAEELTSWNLLSRTSLGHQYVSLRLTILWCLGFVLRYFVLLPSRLAILFIGLTFLVVATAFVGYVPDGQLKRRLNWHISLISYRILCRAVTAIITYHNRENIAKPGGICVANHTSPIDVMILSCDNCYALVGQKHGGLLGIIQRALNRASSHIWFERSEINDRAAVGRRLREHVEDCNKLPILIFPEGTCINNTSVMMFKKGSFEVGGVIYPAAIKYDARFGDAFWNSSKQSYIQYLIMMMTSWAIVVDVRYLPPMTRQEGESAVDFAARVKKAIAGAGGLVDLEWDGQLKRLPVKKEMLEKQQERYSRRIKSSGLNLERLVPPEEIDERSTASEPASAPAAFSIDGDTPVSLVDKNEPLTAQKESSEKPSSSEEHQLQQNGTGLVKRHKAVVENGDQTREEDE